MYFTCILQCAIVWYCMSTHQLTAHVHSSIVYFPVLCGGWLKAATEETMNDHFALGCWCCVLRTLKLAQHRLANCVVRLAVREEGERCWQRIEGPNQARFAFSVRAPPAKDSTATYPANDLMYVLGHLFDWNIHRTTLHPSAYCYFHLTVIHEIL